MRYRLINLNLENVTPQKLKNMKLIMSNLKWLIKGFEMTSESIENEFDMDLEGGRQMF